MRFKIGDHASISKTITEADIALFVAVSGDTNPLHTNAEYAKRSRFGERIAHGSLTASLISNVIGTKLPGVGAVYLSQTLKFIKPVKIGDTINGNRDAHPATGRQAHSDAQNHLHQPEG
ncbi:MAG: MaoC family dehydratase [Deinococcus sp.]|nr:MaoC family dehydratase [Deinococcus sp.]